MLTSDVATLVSHRGQVPERSDRTMWLLEHPAYPAGMARGIWVQTPFTFPHTFCTWIVIGLILRHHMLQAGVHSYLENINKVKCTDSIIVQWTSQAFLIGMD